MQIIRAVAPTIVSRIAGTGTVGLVTEVEGKTLAFFWMMSCIFQEQNTGNSLQASPFVRVLHLTLMEHRKSFLYHSKNEWWL